MHTAAPQRHYLKEVHVTPPPNYGPPPPAAAGNDKTTLWGVLGIVFAFCCFPVGIVFAILSLMEARKVGKQPTLAYVAFGIVVLAFVLNIIGFATGAFDNLTNNN
jgi:heme/copper-type cytochrome/quinol oxidase subunit 1